MISDDVDLSVRRAQVLMKIEQAENSKWWAGQQDRLRLRRQVKS